MIQQEKFKKKEQFINNKRSINYDKTIIIDVTGNIIGQFENEIGFRSFIIKINQT